MGYYKFGRSFVVSLLVVLSASFVPRLPMVLMTSGVLAQTVDARKAEADRLLEQGFEQVQANQLQAALQSFQKALFIYRNIKNRKGEGGTLLGLGLLYKNLQDYPKAIDYYQQSLAIAQEIKDSELEAIVQKQLSDVQIRSNPQKAQADRLLEQGVEQFQTSEFTAALQSWQQALQIYREIKYRKGESLSLQGIGLAYLNLGDYLKAMKYHQQSLKIAREIKYRQLEGQPLQGIGLAYYHLGDYLKAIEYHQQSLKIARKIKDRQLEGQSLGNIGLAYLDLGDYPKAIEYYQKGLKIAREIKYRQWEGQLLGNLGVAYRKLGDYPKTIEYHQQSLKIARKIKDRQLEGQSLGNIGIVYNDNLGDYPKAIEYHQQSLKISREIKYRLGESRSLGNLGNAYRKLGNYPKAIEYQQQSLKIAQEIKDRLGEAQLLNNLGLTYYKKRKLTLAQSNLFEGIKIYESLRGKELKDSQKVTFFDTQRSTYRTLQQVLIAQNKTETALEISERGRGRAFVELLASRLSSNIKEQSPTPPNINQIKQIAKAQNSTLVQYSIIYDDSKESELYIWVIKPTGEVTFRTADLKPLWQKENTTLSELVSTTRKSLGVSDDERSIFSAKVKNPLNEKIQRESLQKLHQLLVKPIADLLPTDPNQRVTFVPQEDLFLVPFPALIDSKGKYLIEKHTILTAPAIQVLELTRQQQKRIKTLPKSSRKNALIVGNPTMPSFNTKYGESGKQLSSLPGAKREAEAIAPLFNTTALTGDEATETAIKAKLPQAGLIHLATHGLFDDFQGLQSSIALAPSSQDNGLLTASEILDIKLNADLVVLSACNTGRGRITGDGVIGLSRSLISAGVPSVLVSLWSVPDSPTASLMTDFYQNLSKNPDKATALREAMLTRMKQHPNPRDWAAFTLIGEAE